MHSFRIQLMALLVAIAFGFGWAHCALDRECSGDLSASTVCQMCVCHTASIAEVKTMPVQPKTVPVESVAVTVHSNARLAAAAIFNPPKA